MCLLLGLYAYAPNRYLSSGSEIMNLAYPATLHMGLQPPQRADPYWFLVSESSPSKFQGNGGAVLSRQSVKASFINNIGALIKTESESVRACMSVCVRARSRKCVHVRVCLAS